MVNTAAYLPYVQENCSFWLHSEQIVFFPALISGVVLSWELPFSILQLISGT